MLWMLVGLGNPGEKYQNTRHNIGFMLADQMVQRHLCKQKGKEHKGELFRLKLGDHHELLVVKPQTFMNLSGECVQAVSHYYKISPSQIMVAHDELDVPLGGLRLQQNRGAGGHNGVKSITQHLGTSDYVRVRIGIGKPENVRMNIADYVLENFRKDELARVQSILDWSEQAVCKIVFNGLNQAANLYNGDKFI